METLTSLGVIVLAVLGASIYVKSLISASDMLEYKYQNRGIEESVVVTTLGTFTLIFLNVLIFYGVISELGLLIPIFYEESKVLELNFKGVMLTFGVQFLLVGVLQDLIFGGLLKRLIVQEQDETGIFTSVG